MSPSSKSNSKKDLSVGVILTSILDDYQQMIMSGIMKQAKKLNVKITCFNAGMFDYKEFSINSKGKVFDLINEDYIDGIIILPGPLMWENKLDELQHILHRCNGIPIISIGISLDGIPSVIVDNYSGMCKLFEHLITIHGCRNIAFVRGPESNPEAVERFRAYKDTLSKHKIIYNEKLVFMGDFETWSGHVAVRHFFNTMEITIDSLVCSDDANSIQAIVELEKIGLKVPDNILVGGFDNIEQSNSCTPPLTTVSQPLNELGEIGLNRISKLLTGEKLTLVERIPTHLVIRKSCGCDLNNSFEVDTEKGTELPDLYDEINESCKVAFPFSWKNSLKSDLFDDIKILTDIVNKSIFNKDMETELNKTLVEIVDKYFDRGITTLLWYEILNKIFRKACQVELSEKDFYNVKYLWKSAALTLNINEHSKQSNAQLKKENRYITVQVVGHRLTSSPSFEAIKKTLAQELPSVGIKNCQIIFMKTNEDTAVRFFSYIDGNIITKNSNPISKADMINDLFNNGSLLPNVIVPLVIGDGNEGFVVYVLDEVNEKFEVITEQLGSSLRTAFLLLKIHQQNMALHESEAENIRMILDSIGDAVIATNSDGKITRMNKVAEKLCGATWSETTSSKTLFDLVKVNSEVDYNRMANSFETILTQGQIGNAIKEISITSNDGVIHQVNYSGAPIRNIDNEIVGIVLVIRDMTEQNLLEEQLNQTRKMDSLGKLASGIAHDLNNMLTGISGNAQMLKLKILDQEKVEKATDKILNITETASELMKNLLAFSHKSSIKTINTDIHTCISNSKNILDHSIDKQIDVQINLEASSHFVLGEAALIQNVIINLCINARDAMPNGGVLTISTENAVLDSKYCESTPFEIVPGDYCALTIKDTGMGMTKETIKKIFEPFYTTKSVGKGTGLGLSAVYGIVTNHKGSISISSEVDKGTSFTIYFPVSQ